jgi:hypothetical protein
LTLAGTGNVDPGGAVFGAVAVTGTRTLTAALTAASLNVTSGTFTLNAGVTVTTGIVLNGGTLNAGSNTLTAGGGLTNNGTLTAAGGTLAVTGNFANSGTVTGDPALILAGTGGVNPGSAVFGAVTVTGTRILTAALTAASLNVTSGTFTLNAGVTVTGAATVNGGTLAVGNNTLTAGTFSQTAGTVSSALGTLSAGGGVNQSGGLMSGSVTVTGTEINLGGNNTLASANLTASSGNITVNNTGNLALTAASSGNITVNNTGNLTLTTTVTAGGSIELTGTTQIAINGNIASGSTGATDVNPAIKFDTSTIAYTAGTTTTGGGNTGLVDIWTDVISGTYIPTLAAPFHLHTKTKHIVYRDGTDSGSYTGIGAASYVYVRADTLPTNPVVLYSPAGCNVYAIDVNDSTGRNVTLGNAGTGFVEFRGNYTSTGPLVLAPGSGGTALDTGAAVALTGQSFSLTGTNKNLVLRGTSPSTASITAQTITLGGTVNGSSTGNNSLTLIAGAISINGATGSSVSLKDITITNGGVFTTSAAIIAAGSFVQNGTGTNTIGGSITAGSISFLQNITLGAPVTFNTSALNGTIGIAGMVNSSVGGRGLTLNSGTGAVTLNNSSATAVDLSGIFTKLGAGSCLLSGGIRTNNYEISFTGPVVLNGNITVNSGTGNVLFNHAVNGPGRTFTVIAGTGNIVFNGIVGQDDTNKLASFVLNNGGTVNVNAEIFAALVDFTGGPNQKLAQNSNALRLGDVRINNTNNGTTVTLTGNVCQRPNSELTLAPNAVLNTGNFSWCMGSYNASLTGFYGFNGTAIFYAGSKLLTRDFLNETPTNAVPALDASHTIKLNGACEITASGLVQINKTFGNASIPDPLTRSTLVVKNTGSLAMRQTSTPVPVYIGNFVVDRDAGTPNVTLGSDVVFKGTVTIKTGAKLIGGNHRIHVLPREPGEVPPGESDNIWTQQSGGIFDHAAEVEFGDATDLAGAHSYSMMGDTVWNDFVCHENSAVLKFSNWTAGSAGHTINGKLDIEPASPSPGTYTHKITLTREDDTPTPGPADPYPNTPNWVPPSSVNQYFWYFTLGLYGELALNEVRVMYSFSRHKIPVPTDMSLPNAKYVEAWPYVLVDANSTGGVSAGSGNWAHLFDPSNCWNVNWFVINKFLYAFTEDSDHNGKIDRLRLQSAFNLNGDFSDFRVTVRDAVTGTPYRVRSPYSLVQTGGPDPYDYDSIYVYLEEQPYADTGTKLYWEITVNTSLKDMATNAMLIGNPPPEIPGDLDQDTGYSTDTAPPRVAYALALPGHNELFFQMSENVNAGIMAATSGPFSLGPSPPGRINGREFLLNLGGNSYSVTDLAVAPSFSVTDVKDFAEAATDLHAPHPSRPYAFMYPMPKYPQDYNYTQPYVPLEGNPPAVPAVPPSYWVISWPPAVVTLPNTTRSSPETHRVSDLLVSIPPRASSDQNYFVWPLWARYTASSATLPGSDPGGVRPGYGYVDPGASFTDRETIWDFSGRYFLERDDITLQSRVNNAFPDNPPSIVYTFGLDERYISSSIHGSPGLWLPDFPGVDFSNMVPYFHPTPSSAIINAPLTGTGRVYNRDFLKTTYPARNTPLEFFYHVNGTPPDLLAGRLEMAAGASVPPDWYRRIRPFGFGLHDVTRQRSSVTILNNVINPEKDERAYLDYTLGSGGRVTIQVFTMEGSLVKVLKRENQGAGTYRVFWDGKNNGGRATARGMYFIRIVAPGVDEIRKVMIVK